MKLIILLSTYISLLVSVASCAKQKEEIIIIGNLENLPDGKMVLYTRDRKTGGIILIDSVQTKKGMFKFSINPTDYPESVSVQLDHYEPVTNTKRIFQYKTNQKVNSRKISTDIFMLENGIQINGKLIEYNSFVGPDKRRVVATDVDRPIIAGKQTRVLYDDSLRFNPIVGDPSIHNINQIKALIKRHPYSYHYLYAIERRASEFSNEKFLSVFQLFDQNLQESRTGKELLTYIKNRNTKRLDFTTALFNEEGQSQPVLNKGTYYNLVILWASWCGPCRREIPSLKKLYNHLNGGPELNLVSISVDEDRQAWMKALQKEQMPWPQLLITPSVRTYVKELFQFDGSIPTMLLIDQQGKVLKKMVGYDANNLIEIEAIVSRKK